jgi:hypothetical protein
VTVGPPQYVLLTFAGEVVPKAMVHGETYYRVVGAGSVAAGCWWMPTPPIPADRAGLAIKPSWNSMTGVVEFAPRSGVVIPAWRGTAAPQAVLLPDGGPGFLRGGAALIWVPWGALDKDKGTFTIRPMGK